MTSVLIPAISDVLVASIMAKHRHRPALVVGDTGDLGGFHYLLRHSVNMLAMGPGGYIFRD